MPVVTFVSTMSEGAQVPSRAAAAASSVVAVSSPIVTWWLTMTSQRPTPEGSVFRMSDLREKVSRT